VQHEFVAFERPAQAGFQHEAFDRLGLDLVGVEQERVAASFLGGIHRRLGVLGERAFILRVGGKQRGADAGGHAAFLTVDRRRLDDGGQYLARDIRNLIGVGDFAQQKHELVAADACDHIALADALLDATGNFDQQCISRYMAERVVDDLEAVEIDEQHGALPAVAAAVLDRAIDLLAEHDAVRQAGEVVVGRQEPGARFDPTLFGDVLESRHDTAVRHGPMRD
jgi:hypothetical protein